MLAGGWWAGGRSGIHYGWGGLYHTQQSPIIEAAGLYDINNEEAQEYGLQLGAKADDSINGSAKHVLGEGGVEDIMDWVGVISTYI
jgi:hypothetical protein